ncbi:hypothetical protein GYA27_01310 [candidate division WWE3 bacterium]|uniref:Uncharacterized protein n=1 Tax=candidate division WWE3 bacterium TaxID=2053526 RepID=A0A7X9DJZ9_UNCKA|nr:hypothetical protein [candidate division WWE3 bacterium]
MSVNINAMTKAELDLYCGLLKYAYQIQIEQTGLVCGADAERLRDEMFYAIADKCL